MPILSQEKNIFLKIRHLIQEQPKRRGPGCSVLHRYAPSISASVSPAACGWVNRFRTPQPSFLAGPAHQANLEGEQAGTRCSSTGSQGST